MSLLNNLVFEMMKYYRNDPKQINHFIKVHAYAKLIAEEEYLDKDLQLIVETVAYIHDIGIKNALAKYNSSVGKLQEKEGPDEARKMLTALGYQENVIERVCYIVAHHHTFEAIDGIDFQILVEADLLTNYYEDNLPKDNILYSYDKIFRTETGKRIAAELFNIEN